MRFILAVILALATLPCFGGEMPMGNVPLALRTPNYKGGSCVHASTGTAFQWSNMPDWAKFWITQFSGGENVQGLASKMDRLGIQYAMVTNGDPAFLDWAQRTRRIVIIEWGGMHMVNLVHFDDKWACILNNNHINDLKWETREQFIREWKGYGGWAVVLLYDPVPPLPKVSK